MNVIYIIYLSTLCAKIVGKWGNGMLFQLKVKILQWTNFNTFLTTSHRNVTKSVFISYFKSVYLSAHKNFKAVEKF